MDLLTTPGGGFGLDAASCCVVDDGVGELRSWIRGCRSGRERAVNQVQRRHCR